MKEETVYENILKAEIEALKRKIEAQEKELKEYKTLLHQLKQKLCPTPFEEKNYPGSIL